MVEEHVMLPAPLANAKEAVPLEIRKLAIDVFQRADRDAIMRALAPALVSLLIAKNIITRNELMRAIDDWYDREAS